MSTEIRFIDTTLRDGNQSTWAFNMRTGMMLAALPHLDQAGFDGMEFFVPTLIKKMVQHLGEDPLQWLKRGAGRQNSTSLRLHGGIRSGLSKVPLSVARLLMEMVVAHGIRVTRASDPWNDFREFAVEVEDLRNVGIESVVNLIYSESPKHTDAYFVERARQAVALRPYRICFKDVGGLLTPERTRHLARLIQEAVGDIPLEFHAHCNNTLAPLNVLEAVKEGIRYIHTAVPPLANGTSQPSIFNVAANLRALGYTPVVDEAPLRTAAERLTTIAQQHDLPIGQPLEYDYGQYQHQVPGGMRAHLRYQLQLVGMEHRLQETLEEAGRVRAEFGYPIMVTPLSQFVGTQAAINVIVGARYGQVSDQTIHYALGRWGGREAIEAMAPDVRDRILSRPRGRELAAWEPPDPSIEEIRKQYGGPGISDEEMLLRMETSDAERAAMHAAGTPTEFSVERPLVELVRELTKQRDRSFVQVQKDGMAVTLVKRGG